MKISPSFAVSSLAILATVTVFVAPLQAADFYVSPKGSDADTGTRNSPFATLERARDAARVAQKPATIWLAGGDYSLTKPLELGAADSGTVWRNMDGQTPRLIGARRLAAGDFKPIADAATLERIAPELRGKIVELDLRALNIQHGKPFPDVFNDSGGLLSLYFGGRRMPLSRFPNEGFMTMRRVTDNGIAPAPIGGTFEYRAEFAAQHARWQKQVNRGVWLKGYWRIPWQNEAIRVGAIDIEKQTVTFAKPIQGGIGNKYTRPEGNGKEPYWALNLLEEIDAPGEWAVDFKDQKLYFYPPQTGGEILLADTDAPLISVVGASNVTLRGLTLEGCLGDGIVIKGGENNLVAGCEIRNVDKYAARLDGGMNSAIQSCDLHELGEGGVWLGGGDESVTPRIAANHRAVNNHIWNFAQIVRVYAPGVNCGFTGGGGGGHHVAVGMLVAHNLIHDTPHVGVLFGSFDSIFEFNEVFRYCTISNDMGAFYSYFKQEGNANHTFRYNLMHSSDDGDGLYWDHDHKDMHVYGNIAYLKSKPGGRGTGFLYKIGTQAQTPYANEDCHDNVSIACNYGFQFVNGVVSKMHDNASVQCINPFSYSLVKDGKAVKTSAEALGASHNVAFNANPGFFDIEKLDFRVRPDSQLAKEFPAIAQIPVEKIGLYLDEYRKKLPTNDEIDRFDKRTKQAGTGLVVGDRN